MRAIAIIKIWQYACLKYVHFNCCGGDLEIPTPGHCSTSGLPRNIKNFRARSCNISDKSH